jgi:hypothetical protein
MKKILISLLLSITTLFIFYLFKPIVLKYAMGNAIILNEVSAYSVSIDGKIYKDVLFKNKSTFILFLDEEKIKTDYNIVSINLEDKIIGFNCASNNCYDTFLGNLFQSDMGKMYTFFDNTIKGVNFDTDLKIYGDSIEFYIPKKGNGKIHIQLNLQDSCL